MFVQVQFGRVGRERLDRQARSVLAKERPHNTGAVNRSAIPDDQYLALQAADRFPCKHDIAAAAVVKLIMRRALHHRIRTPHSLFSTYHSPFSISLPASFARPFILHSVLCTDGSALAAPALFP